MREIKVSSPPIHTHFNEENEQAELCNHVFCPKGFVGIEVIDNTHENTKPLQVETNI